MLERTPTSPTNGDEGRRRFLERASALVATALLGACQLDRVQAPERRDSSASDPGESSRVRYSAASIPHVESTYLPPSYRFWQRVVGPLRGFHGGLDEIEVVYLNPSRPRGEMKPLSIFSTLHPRRPCLGAGEAMGRSYALTISPDRVIAAAYYDGYWMPSPSGELDLGGIRLRWDTSGVHTLVFLWEDLLVGVRGFRGAGVDLEQLARVGASVRRADTAH